MKMRFESILSCFLLISCLLKSISFASVEQQCNTEVTKLSECINFATGKAASPTDKCCSSVGDMRSRKPVCLCYIIQQAHDGVTTFKQLGLQEAKLLQLPSACKLANASVSDCPKLLDLSPSSPDYNIFTNSSSAGSSNSTVTPSPIKSDSSNGFMYGPQLVGPTAITVSVAVFLSVFPTGLINMFYTGE